MFYIFYSYFLFIFSNLKVSWKEGVYLLQSKYYSLDFIHNILCGKKKVFKLDKVKFSKVIIKFRTYCNGKLIQSYSKYLFWKIIFMICKPQKLIQNFYVLKSKEILNTIIPDYFDGLMIEKLKKL